MGDFNDERDYFYPYAFLTDQRQMLMDSARMDAYHAAITANPSHFRGKAVLDCGTGTGVLAIWAAQAGARVVYAVEATDVCKHTRALVAANGVQDVVKVIHGRIEDVSLPEKVDTIVSEWMGLLLLRDGMLNSVLYARDKWLLPGGALFPSHCQLLLAPTVYSEDSMASHETRGRGNRDGHESDMMAGWATLVEEIHSKYRVDYACLTGALAEESGSYHLQSAIEDILGGEGGEEDDDEWGCEIMEGGEFSDDDCFGAEEESIVAAAAGVTIPSRWAALQRDALLWDGENDATAVIKEFDCHTVSETELRCFDGSFRFRMDGGGGGCGESTGRAANSVTCWFDVYFHGSASLPADQPVTLSTGPAAAPTHWGQQTFVLPEGPNKYEVTAGSPPLPTSHTLSGSIQVAQLPTTHRMYDVRLEADHTTSTGSDEEQRWHESLHYSIE